MCGIVGYIGEKEAYPIIIKGLKRLEYRGYDSSGVALLNDQGLKLYKRKGKVSDLEEFTESKDKSGFIGIGHTRWATHGEPNDLNAHPHVSGDGKLALIHNGIIENYASLKEELSNRGHVFHSDTDTEVLVHLIEDVVKNTDLNLFDSVRVALNEVIGAYAIVVLDKENDEELIVAKKSSPLVVGIGEPGEFFIASDATPIIEYTKNVVYLEDEEIALVNRKGGLKIVNIQNQPVTPYIQELELQLEALEKGGYDHFMLKEIYEQPRSITDCFRGRMNLNKGLIKMSGIDSYEGKWKNEKEL